MPTPTEVPTRQEMFNRAWKGLAAQGWQRAYDDKDGTCVYLTSDGLRCAWGHVDPENTENRRSVSVYTLADNGCGIAAMLSEPDLAFAARLQMAHDSRCAPKERQERFRKLALREHLTIPEEQ